MTRRGGHGTPCPYTDANRFINLILLRRILTKLSSLPRMGKDNYKQKGERLAPLPLYCSPGSMLEGYLASFFLSSAAWLSTRAWASAWAWKAARRSLGMNMEMRSMGMGKTSVLVFSVAISVSVCR